MAKILITGATGFIGRHLCPALLDLGFEVRGSYRGSSPPRTHDSRIEWVCVGELGPETEWHSALDGVEYVVHSAGLAHQVGVDEEDIRTDLYRVNTEGTRRLANAVAERPRIKRLVFVSSIKALPNTAEPSEELDSIYGRSKQLAEDALEEELLVASSDWSILRPCLVYGPGNLGNMARLLRLINTGLPLPFASIRNRRSFLFVGNLVNAILACLTHPGASRRSFAVDDGEPLSTPDLFRELSRSACRRLWLFPLPMPVLKGVAHCGDIIEHLTGKSVGWNTYSVERLCGSLVANSSEIRDRTGWTPPYSTSQGLQITFSSVV
jgi:nucleoside-diphosphate-sugar epimerase